MKQVIGTILAAFGRVMIGILVILVLIGVAWIAFAVILTGSVSATRSSYREAWSRTSTSMMYSFSRNTNRKPTIRETSCCISAGKGRPTKC